MLADMLNFADTHSSWKTGESRQTLDWNTLSRLDVFNTFIRKIYIENVQAELVVWDNTGSDSYDGLRRLSYKEVHVIFICFDISNPESAIDNIKEMVSC